jgi:hypothetical protein
MEIKNYFFYKEISLEVIRDKHLKFLAHRNITFEQKVLLDNIWFTNAKYNIPRHFTKKICMALENHFSNLNDVIYYMSKKVQNVLTNFKTFKTLHKELLQEVPSELARIEQDSAMIEMYGDYYAKQVDLHSRNKFQSKIRFAEYSLLNPQTFLRSYKQRLELACTNPIRAKPLEKQSLRKAVQYILPS